MGELLVGIERRDLVKVFEKMRRGWREMSVVKRRGG